MISIIIGNTICPIINCFDERNIGREEGREEGRKMEREEVAKRMLDCGMEIEQIAKLTQLNIETIMNLQ